MKIQLIVTLVVLLFMSFLSFSQSRDNHLGAIVFNLKFSSFNERGFGGKVKIANMDTGEEFLGKSANGFNSHIIIRNLPKGVYKVVELLIRMGSGQIHYYDTLKFNQIEVSGGETLYLGSYRAKKTSEFFKLNYELLRERNIDTVELNKKSLKLSGIGSNIDFTQKLFKSDTTYFSLR